MPTKMARAWEQGYACLPLDVATTACIGVAVIHCWSAIAVAS